MKKALIAMSGGVDSSVAAFLMKERGFECTGVTMRLFRGNEKEATEKSCCSDKDTDDAAEIAYKLDIPFEVIDLSREFESLVIKKFIRIYEEGGVPNPCIDCNSFMKFGLLLETALARGFDYVVTGHYARTEKNENGRYILKKAVVPEKDQSYVLYGMTQEQLSHVIFPLGDISKEETRKIAGNCGFVNAAKHDSQDICFVPDGDYASFMERYTGKAYPDGDIVNKDGKILGRHHGAVRYTNGQRRGLGVSAPERLYVSGKDMEKNLVYVGDESELYSDMLFAEHVNWISIPSLQGEMRVRARTRYNQKEQPASVFPDGNDRIRVVFDAPQRAITPGQAVVMYDGEMIVGGGTIIGKPVV
ncbi:MAG: tRNA 2-thiouridine(34) synthase MnmA [Lachnospiraceae bacterium]|nr:tRNA 2-thiouridine(34) synthase MnmA [Lachnospiraceae bacterium]